MRLLSLVVALPLLTFVACAPRAPRTPLRELPPSIARVNPPEEEPENEDSFQEAAEFYLLKRVGPGQELPVERYLDAKRHAERMPQYSIGRRRFVPRTLAASAAGADVGT